MVSVASCLINLLKCTPLFYITALMFSEYIICSYIDSCNMMLTQHDIKLQVFISFNFTIFFGHWFCIKDIRQHNETLPAILLEHWKPRKQPKYIWTGTYNRGICTNVLLFWVGSLCFAETLRSVSTKPQLYVPFLLQKMQIHIMVCCFCTSMMAILHCTPLTCLSREHLTKHHLLWISPERGVGCYIDIPYTYNEPLILSLGSVGDLELWEVVMLVVKWLYIYFQHAFLKVSSICC